jgi:excisionase family DNA binding protein
MELQDPISIEKRDRLQITTTEPLWTVEDVADYLRIQPETVRMKARAKEIPAIKVGKMWRFKVNEIKEMLKSKAE